MRLYLKLFLAAFLPYALVGGLIVQDAVWGLLFGAGVGLVIALVFGTLQHQAFAQSKQKQAASRSVHQTRELEVDLPYADALQLCREAAISLPRGRLSKTDRLAGEIEVRTRLNWLTYGEKVTLRLRPLSATTTLVQISSRPRLKTTLIDYGRNLHHVNWLSHYVRAASGSDHLAEDATNDTASLEADTATPRLSHRWQHG